MIFLRSKAFDIYPSVPIIQGASLQVLNGNFSKIIMSGEEGWISEQDVYPYLKGIGKSVLFTNQYYLQLDLNWFIHCLREDFSETQKLVNIPLINTIYFYKRITYSPHNDSQTNETLYTFVYKEETWVVVEPYDSSSTQKLLKNTCNRHYISRYIILARSEI